MIMLFANKDSFTFQKKLSKVCGRDFPGGTMVKNPPANAGDKGSSPGPRRSHRPRSNETRAPQLLSLRSRGCEPQLLSLWATTTEPVSHNYWARVPQLLKPVRLEPVLLNKRSHHNEKPAHRKWRVAPARHN